MSDSSDMIMNESEDALIESEYDEADPDSDPDEAQGATHIDIKMEETIYSDIVFATEAVAQKAEKGNLCQLSSTIFLMLLLALTQFVILNQMMPMLAKDQLKDKLKISETDPETQQTTTWNELEEWALEDGNKVSHDDKSLAMGQKPWKHWACSGKDWSWQESQLGDQADYHTMATSSLGFTNGRLFGLIALSLWMAMVLKELRSIARYIHLLCLPSDGDGYHQRKANDFSNHGAPKWYLDSIEKKWYLDSLSVSAKGVVVIIAIWRLVVNIWLGYKGALFLAYTETLKDFVLNSIALGFIFDLDEMVFQVALSSGKQTRVQQCEPVMCSSPSGWVGKAVQENVEWIILGLGTFLVVLIDQQELKNFSWRLICEGFMNICADSGTVLQNVKDMCPDNLADIGL